MDTMLYVGFTVRRQHKHEPPKILLSRTERVASFAVPARMREILADYPRESTARVYGQAWTEGQLIGSRDAD